MRSEAGTKSASSIVRCSPLFAVAVAVCCFVKKEEESMEQPWVPSEHVTCPVGMTVAGERHQCYHCRTTLAVLRVIYTVHGVGKKLMGRAIMQVFHDRVLSLDC